MVDFNRRALPYLEMPVGGIVPGMMKSTAIFDVKRFANSALRAPVALRNRDLANAVLMFEKLGVERSIAIMKRKGALLHPAPERY